MKNMLRAITTALLLMLASTVSASAQCSGQAPATTYCGNPTGSTALPGWKAISGLPFALTVGISTVSGGGTNRILYQASAGGLLSAITTANSSILVTDSGGVPSLSTTLPAHTLGGTITGGSQTVTAVVITNSSIGSSSPSTGAFTSAAYSTTLTGTSANANALAIGRQGATNPALQVDASTATSATGIKIKSAAAAGGVAMSVITSGTNENFAIDAAGSGTVSINATGTGSILLNRAITYGTILFANTTTGSAGSSLVGSISPTLTGSPLAPTQAVDDNSTKIATTAYVDRIAKKIISVNTTFNVATTGTDSNNCTSGAPCLTIQRAYDNLVDFYEMQGNATVVTIQVANGTYTAGLYTSRCVVGQNGPGAIKILGSATASNVIISTTSNDAFGLGELAFGAGTQGCTQITIGGMRLQTTTGGNAINVSGGGVGITFSDSGFPIDFGTTVGDHIVANHSAWVIAGSNYSISGNALIHAAAISNSTVAIHNVTVTCSGAPAFTYFTFTDTNGALFASGMTFTSCGTATGTRAFAGSGGMIYTNNSSASYLPGNVAYVEFMGGKYIGAGALLPTGANYYTSGIQSYVPFGTNVATALGVNVGSAGAFVTFNGALGTPSSGTVTNLTGTASININGTVGATTPATVAATTVSASTSVASPLYIGSSATTGTTLEHRNTSGVGTTDAQIFTGGNAGATRIATMLGTGRMGVGSAVGAQTPTNATLVASNNTAVSDGSQIFSIASVLQVVNVDSANGGLAIDAFAGIPAISFRKTNGTAASKTAVAANDTIGAFFGQGYQTTTSAYALGPQISLRSAEAWTSTANGSYLSFFTVANGTTSQIEAVRVQNSSGVSIGAAVVATDPGAGGLIANGATIRFTALANVATTSAVCYNTGTGLLTYNATVGTCTVSDGRLKNVDGPITGALDRLLTIKGVGFTWKDPAYGEGHQIGVIAQDVEKAFPELVSTDSIGHKSADYQRLTAPIIEALRELKAANDNLTRRIAKLESRK